MGLNLVIACRPCQQSRWIARGEEQVGIVSFYTYHWRCNIDAPGSIIISDDQGEGDTWRDAPWTCEEWWGPDGPPVQEET